jgi:L-2-hydroxyglutarate oxidase LhgO|tara:strand:+ start:603 stop:800 length:198 start_codon:yes stop_codon:yes gene_type:complete
MASKGRTKKFPQIKEKNEGKFTSWAKNNGFKNTCSAASSVMKNTGKYTERVVKMANYAKNFGCKR